jgi:uncharacterized membrane protein
MSQPAAAEFPPFRKRKGGAPAFTAGVALMGTLYVVAGVLHFVATRRYEAIIPAYLPAHRALVLISGAAEIAGGLGVLYPRTRRPAAIGIILLLLAVFPANLWMAQHPERFPGIPLWLLWIRLPLQAALIAWAWRYTRKSTQIPASRSRRTPPDAKPPTLW